MATTLRNMFILPNELIAYILAMLHYRDLASSIQVCKRMVNIIGGSALLQYHLELGRSGMEDGPMSTLSIPERRAMLRVHNDAWKHLRWSACIELPKIDKYKYSIDIAPGGILTCVSRSARSVIDWTEDKMIFVQIPSNSRGIPMRQWEHTFSFTLNQYALDPSEDILVVFQFRHQGDAERRFHFLSLTTGEPHPLVATTLLSESHRLMRSLDLKSFQLSMAQNYLAILDPMYELCVCNWKTGQIVLSSSSNAIGSVSFFPDNRFLLATVRVGDLSKDPILEEIGNFPVLAVYDLDQASASLHKGVPSPIAVFSLNLSDDLRFNPRDKLHPYCLGIELDPGEMELYYHFNIHSYSNEVAVPFFSPPSEQLIGLRTSGFHRRFRVGGDDPTSPLMLLIPIVRLTSHIDRATADNVPMIYVPWNDWGATGTGWSRDPHLLRFPRQVSSSRIIPAPPTRDFLDVWDFSRARVAQLEPQHCRLKSLPCVQTRVALPKEMMEATAISEDALICEHWRNHSIYLLVF